MELIEDLLSVTSINDNPCFSENSEVPADCWLGKTDFASDLIDCHLTISQDGQYFQACWIAKGFEVFRVAF